jgi:hypothetical protein
MRARRKRTDVGKYSFVNRTIADWNQLAEGEILRVNHILSGRGLGKC